MACVDGDDDGGDDGDGGDDDGDNDNHHDLMTGMYLIVAIVAARCGLEGCKASGEVTAGIQPHGGHANRCCGIQTRMTRWWTRWWWCMLNGWHGRLCALWVFVLVLC